MLIIAIEESESESGHHSMEEQPWRTEVWQEGYARVPEEWREEVMACRGYCDLEVADEKYTVIVEPEAIDLNTGEIIPLVTEQCHQPVVINVITKEAPPEPEPMPDLLLSIAALTFETKYELELLKAGII